MCDDALGRMGVARKPGRERLLPHLPEALDGAGDAPAGHFHYGAPPPELGLDLPPYDTIAPQAGMLALFPSILWHGTVPTRGGTRLNIAFDIVPAAG